MKNLYNRLAFTYLFISAILLIAADGAWATHVVCQPLFHLRQSDFSSGTYRIKTPGIYVLDQDIEFDPIPQVEAKRTDKPLTGWFAAMTVETDNVTIDLNGKTLQASQHFVDNHIFSLYANLELSNSPFSGNLFGLVGASFPGDETFVSGNHVIVKNGTLGRSSHWGVHGNNNRFVQMCQLTIKDFQVAGAELNGLVDSQIQDVKISGNEHVIRVTSMTAAAYTLIQYLESLAEGGFPGAADQLAQLIPFVEANPQIFDNPTMIPPNSQYGLLISSGFPSVTPFPATPEGCALGAFLSGGRTVNNLKLENISIDGIKNAPQEFVLIGSNATDSPAFNTSLIGLPVFGCGRWTDAFDANGNFAPNPLLQAQVFAVNSQIVLNPGLTESLPPNYSEIAASILVPDEAVFLNETLPLFGLALDSFEITGTFGIRLDCSNNSRVRNCSVQNVQNLGSPGIEVSQLPDGGYYSDLVQTRYKGNDIWGYEFANNGHAIIQNCHSSTVSSTNGDVFGLDLAGNDAILFVKNCRSLDLFAFGDNTASVVNPSSVVYGFRVQNNTGLINFNQCKSDRLTSPRFVFGFAAQDCEGIQFQSCEVKKIRAVTSQKLSSPKQAFGFDLESAINTLIKCATVDNVMIGGEKNVKKSNSIAAGIAIDKGSENTTIISTKIANVQGGAGSSFPVDDLGVNTKIKKGNGCSRHCD